MKEINKEVIGIRRPTYPIDPLFLNRWSPRAMTGENLSEEKIMSLFEAARWAPSSYNNQPWLFIYAMRDTPEWNTLYSLMIEFNQAWTQNAGALIVVVSKNTFYHNGKPANTHSFDTGAAWMSLALQATLSGLVAHAMQGFDYNKAKSTLQIPEDYTVEAMIAIGKQAPKEKLPPEIAAKEAPSIRRELSQIVMKGKFLKQ